MRRLFLSARRTTKRGRRTGRRSMRFMAATVLAAVFLSVAASPALADTIWSETFETTPLTGWSLDNFLGYDATHWGVATWTARSGSRSLWAAQDHNSHWLDHTYNDNMSAYARHSVDLSTYEDATLTFWYRINSADAPGPHDMGAIHINGSELPSGGRFIPGNVMSNGTTITFDGKWHQAVISLKNYVGQSSVELEWVWISDSAGNHSAEGWILDDITVSGFHVVSPTSLTGGDHPSDNGGQVDLAWEASSTGGASYKVYKSTKSGGPYTYVGATSGLSYLVTGLSSEVQHHFVVRATNGIDDSPYSAEVAATPADNIAPYASRLSAGFIRNEYPVTSVLYNDGAYIDGYLTARGSGLSGKHIVIRYKSAGWRYYKYLGTYHTDTEGHYRKFVRPLVNTAYLISFARSGSYLASSATWTLKVQPRVTVSATTWGITGGRVGQPMSINGSVTPNHRGKRVYIQRLVGTTWTTIATRYLNSGSMYIWNFTPSAGQAGQWILRTRFGGDSNHGVAYSPMKSFLIVP